MPGSLFLKEMCEQGIFREDLYYRLHIIPLHIPLLCDRREDIPLLVQHLTEETHIHDQVMQSLISYNWPGNVRELENTI